MTVVLWMSLAAYGQTSPTDEDYIFDDLNVETFRPALDPGAMAATESLQVPTGFIVRADLWTSHNLLLWQSDDPSDGRVDVIGDVLTLHLAAAKGISEKLRLGASAPLHVLARSDVFSVPAPAPGDLTFSAKYQLQRRFGFLGSLSAPLGGGALQLGSPSPVLDLGVVTGFMGERLRALANGGVRVQEAITLDNVDASISIGPGIWFRGGLGTAVRRDIWLSAEVHGTIYGPSVFEQPLEGMLSMQRTPSGRGRFWRVGLGVGLQGGVGAPTWRLMIGGGRQAD
ncbi:MAG: hypothetical protein AAFV53_10350 [Myxococcota bacterium]